MNQRHIGVILIIAGVLFTLAVFGVKHEHDALIDAYVQKAGTCYLEDNTCLHEEKGSPIFVLGYVAGAAVLILGIYLVFFDRVQKTLESSMLNVSDALLEAKKQEKAKDEFNAFLSAFSEDEQSVLKAVREQEGILQSTLRYRTGMSKSRLSLMLKALEEKGLISRNESGKSNKIFLIRKF